MSSSIRWLHLSDFHVGKDGYASRKMFEYIHSHVEQRKREGFEPDLLFLTGDLADSGLAPQFNDFWTEFAIPLQRIIGNGIEQRTFVVPGNHDVDRTENKFFSPEEMLDQSSRAFDPTDEGLKARQILLPRFQAFNNSDQTTNKGAFTSPSGAYGQKLNIRGTTIGIAGVNTAWLCKDGSDEKRLTPGKGMVEQALEGLEGAQIRIVLGHHPLEWLRPSEQKMVKSLFGQSSVIYLHGHLHEQWAEPTYGGGSSFLVIQTGAAFQARENEPWRNGLVWGETDLDAGELRLQAWNWIPTNQCWAPVTDAFHERHHRGDWWHYPLPGKGINTTGARSHSDVKPTLETRDEPPRRTALHFHGNQRRHLFEQLQGAWLAEGPAVAILQGFPGCGKTELAISIAGQNHKVLNPIEVNLDSSDPSLDVLEALASDLRDRGIGDLDAELDKGERGNMHDALLKVLRRERVLIVLDEFQRLFEGRGTLPPEPWQKLVEALNNSHRPQGRLLLISNRDIGVARWCDKCSIHTLEGFPDDESATYLQQMLEEKGVASRVPIERMDEIGKRLGGNPRAIKTLAASLMRDDLDDLLSIMPSLEHVGDVELKAELLTKFERELITRTIPNLEDEAAVFMRWLSVHRRPISKTFYLKLNANFKNPSALRSTLLDRFLLDHLSLGDSMHPIAREVSVTRLRESMSDWQRAHSLAADFHLERFKATQSRPAKGIASSFSEVRHHLAESGRIKELYGVSARMTRFVLDRIPKLTLSKTPDTFESLEEHIALISALPDEKRGVGLEYHLALCLRKRGIGSDYADALLHVRRAARADSYYAVWLLLIDLEYALNGADAMKRAMNQALSYLGKDSNAFAVYHSCAKMLDQAGRLDEAIELLERAIKIPGMACVTSLVGLCSGYLRRLGQADRATALLTKFAGNKSVQEIGLLYSHLATSLKADGRIEEAIGHLDQAIATKGMTKLFSLYLQKADCWLQLKEVDFAINTLLEGIADTRVIDPIQIYCRCAELMASMGRTDDAIELMNKGVQSRAVRSPVPLYHSLAETLERTGHPEEGVHLLEKAVRIPSLRTEASLYLVWAKIWFRQRKLPQALAVLNQGLEQKKMSGRNQLIQMKAELTSRLGHSEEAIRILQTAIVSNPDPKHLESLYDDCAELMATTGDRPGAIALLKNAINAPAIPNKSRHYQHCAKLLVKEGHPGEAVALLEQALTLPGITGTVILYQECSRILVAAGRRDDAIDLLIKGIRGPKIGNMGSLFQLCAELLVSKGQLPQAISLLAEGTKEYPKDQGVRNLYSKLIG